MSETSVARDGRPIILTFVAYYLPAFRAGGAARSVANLVERLSDELAFRIVTADRDFGDTGPFPGIRQNAWQRVGEAEVFYAAPGALTPARVRSLIAGTPHDVLYFNSLFNPQFTLLPLAMRALRLTPRRPLVLAPRGELSAGALAISARKKQLALGVSRAVGLYDDVVWQASSGYEEADIRSHFERPGRSSRRIVIAPDLPTRVAAAAASGQTPPKRSGELRAVFLSRVTRKKNLDGALRVLAGVEGRVSLDVYGPLEDPGYWAECQRLIASLPPNISVAYRGEVAYEDVPRTFAGYDLLLFPTHGENFGHVIIEAMAAGCPVMISDATPFRDLAARDAGWDLPLADVARWRELLTALVRLDAAGHERLTAGARRYADALLRSDEAEAANRALFLGVAGRRDRSASGAAPRRPQYIA